MKFQYSYFIFFYCGKQNCENNYGGSIIINVVKKTFELFFYRIRKMMREESKEV